jgi:phosphoribosylanthranilate isomerase
MRAKICGITNLDDALLATQHGAWALGFNLYRGSPRYIPPNKIKKIIQHIPENIIKIGIFIDSPAPDIIKLMSDIDLDYAQIYEPKFNNLDNDFKFILGLNLNSDLELPSETVLRSYHAILVDAPKMSDLKLGGTGRLANWDLAKKLAMKYKLILAGGLTPENVNQAIQYVKPYAVDVASGIEYSLGIKNPILLKQFLSGGKDDNI